MSEPSRQAIDQGAAGGPAPGERIAALDGLRGLACLIVLVGHYFGEVAHGVRFLRLEWLGVDLFFCLSGFLIGGILLDNLARPSCFATFYIRRGFRIFPIYFTTVTLVLLALPWFPTLADPALPAGLYFGYVQNFVMAATGAETTSWLMPTWTLCVEEQFYLLLPVLLLYLGRQHLLVPALLLLIAGASLFRTGLVLGGANKLALHMLLPSEWDLLFLGVLGAHARRDPALWHWLVRDDRAVLKRGIFGGLAVVPLLAIADSLLGWRSFDMFGRLALGTGLTGLVLLLVSGAAEAARFRGRTLRFFGLISYGLYLIHQPVAGLLHGLILGNRPDIATLPQVAVTVAAIAASVGLACLSWTYFENALIRIGHRWRYREAAAAAPD